MREFKLLLDSLSQTFHYLEPFMKIKDQFESSRLHRLLTLDTECLRVDGSNEPITEEEVMANPEAFVNGLFPSCYMDEIKKNRALILWKKAHSSTGKEIDVPEPTPGIDAEFDGANDKVDAIKKELDNYLIEIRRMFDRDRRINFSHAKYRYELEIPQEHVAGNKKPDHFEFTSQRKGYERFHTDTIKKLVDRLEVAEESLKDAMVPFLAAIFGRFHDMKDLWNMIVNILTEVDCLMSLAIYSHLTDAEMCFPEMIPYSGEYEHRAFFDIKAGRHPCVVMPQGKAFIPNDTTMDPANGSALLLVTGPNMGGKSTILR